MTDTSVTDQASTLRLELRLSATLDQPPRGRCPIAYFFDGPVGIAAVRTDEPKPHLDARDGAFTYIDASDVISRVIDEEAWLRELGRVLAPGGTLRFDLPASGPLAWLDARNIYRYITDVTRRGDAPDDALPTGWNRHYTERAVREMLSVASLRAIAFRRSGIGITEVPQLAGFMARNFVLGDREAERKLHPLRERMEEIEGRLTVPGIGTMLHVRATKPLLTGERGH